MDSAYFTGRKEIIYFFNKLLHMNLTKIEETASGAVACQLMDYIFPGSIPMKRVNWEARSDFQYVENYKLLQAAFTKHNVQKYIHVDRLVRGKYQDNLEFCQWLKALFEHVCIDLRVNYNPVTRRIIGKGGRNLQPQFCPQNIFLNVNFIKKPLLVMSSRELLSKRSTLMISKTSSLDNNLCSKKSTINKKKKMSLSPKLHFRGPRTKFIHSTEIDKKLELQKKNTKLFLLLGDMEKERDFYLEKLNGIEAMLQIHDKKSSNNDTNNFKAKLYSILYSKLENDIAGYEQIINDPFVAENNLLINLDD